MKSAKSIQTKFSFPSAEQLLDEAHRLLVNEKLSVIPVRDKKALCRWKQFQSKRPTKRQLEKLFSRENATGIAVITGAVSGNLVVRDFDRADAYDEWVKAYPRIAAIVPTIQTSRGFHVYFRCQEATPVTNLGDGEVRGDGGYVVTAPSLHPSGYRYAAIRPIAKIPHFQTLSDAGIRLPSAAATPGLPAPPTSNGAELQFLRRALGVTTISDAIRETQPTEVGERYNLLGVLARIVKINLGLSGLAPQVIDAIATKWHEMALPIIGTKPLSETLADFESWYSNARFGYGNFLPTIPEMVNRDQRIAPYQGNGELVWKACLAAQAFRGDEKFFLSSRTLSRMFSMSHQTAATWIRKLREDGWIVPVPTDDRAPGLRTAPCFKFINSKRVNGEENLWQLHRPLHKV